MYISRPKQPVCTQVHVWTENDGGVDYGAGETARPPYGRPEMMLIWVFCSFVVQLGKTAANSSGHNFLSCQLDQGGSSRQIMGSVYEVFLVLNTLKIYDDRTKATLSYGTKNVLKLKEQQKG